jgi:hypothetical protein
VTQSPHLLALAELLGAHYIDTVEIPPHSDMRKLGIDAVRRYRWTL